jgi:hypothetical protein
MGLSETIIAASIGAAATLTTALFQLFSVLKSGNKPDSRPKRGNTFRSIAAVFALMLASAVGGFMFSEFRQERTAQDMHSMREELNAKLQVLATTTERLAASRVDGPEPASAVSVQVADRADGVESVVYAPACAQGSGCSEESGVSYALCGAIPLDTAITELDLFASLADAGESSTEAQFEQDLGGAKFTGTAAEYIQAGRKAVCVNFKHWSDRPHVARMVVHFGQLHASPDALTPMQASHPVTAQTAQPALVATGSAPVSGVQNAALDGRFTH